MKLKPRKFNLGAPVQVDRPSGTHLGRVFGYEPGPNLNRWGGPFPMWAYHVRLGGVGGEAEEIVVAEEAMAPMVELGVQ